MAYLLDTVTLSEFRKGAKADPSVLSWQASIGEARTFISVVSLNEICYGIRKIEQQDTAFADLLKQWYALLVSQPERFALLDIDRTIAEAAADYRYSCKMSYNDALIAATAKLHSLTLVTRNTSDFQSSGLELVNPWRNR